MRRQANNGCLAKGCDMGRWIGIDHGSKRTGIAAGGSEEKIATAVSVIPSTGSIERIKKIAAEYEAVGIVVGWPVNMDGSEGPQAKLARAMAAELAQATGLDVRLWDERLSSFVADKALAGTMTRMKRRAKQDAVAAAVILQDFLTYDGPATAIRPDEHATPDDLRE